MLPVKRTLADNAGRELYHFVWGSYTVGELGVGRLSTVAVALMDPSSPVLDAHRAMHG